jgi:hypothetical protein
VVSIEVIAGATANAGALANPKAAATDARIILEFWRIFFFYSIASQTHLLAAHYLRVNDKLIRPDYC